MVATGGLRLFAACPLYNFRPYHVLRSHLEQQLFPVETWGQRYLAVRSMQRGAEQELWRVLAREDDTVVEFTPSVFHLTLAAGGWIELETNETFLWRRASLSWSGNLAAEQALVQGGILMMRTPATRLLCLRCQSSNFDNYVFLAPDKYAEDYVSIAFRTGEDARLDGTSR